MADRHVADALVFGDGYGPTAFVSVLQGDDGRWLAFTVQHGWASTDVFALDTRAVEPTPIEIAKGLDARFYPRFVNGELWMRTDLEAPRNRVVAVNLARPAVSAWRTVVAEQPEVLEDVTVIDGALYAQLLHEAASRIVRFDLDGTRRDEVRVPPMHAASIRGDGPGHAVLTLESFAAPETSWRVNLATGARTPDRGGGDRLGRRERRGALRRRHVEGRHPRARLGGAQEGPRPHQRDPDAAFRLRRLLCRAEAVVLAPCRGVGGSRRRLRDGDPARRERVRRDLAPGRHAHEQAAGVRRLHRRQRVAHRGSTRAALTLGIMGTSNGGLLVGAALTQRPDLFRAVLCGFPDVDILRFDQYTTNNNMPALLEYGDAAVKAQFDVIRTYSPYQAVRAGTPYPAVLLASGDLDTRVPPLAARKFTARLQAATTSGHPILLRYHAKGGHAANYGMPFSLRVQQMATDLAFMMRELGLPVP